MTLFTQKLNLNIIPRWIPIVLLIVALIGFADATYLTVEHYLNKIPPCSIGGCETVLTSPYSQVFGIPVSLFGSIYYFVIVLTLFMYFDTKKEIFLRFPMTLSFLGMLFSLWFMIIMAFVIQAICPYCIVSAVTSTTIFIVSLYILVKFKIKI